MRKKVPLSDGMTRSDGRLMAADLARTPKPRGTGVPPVGSESDGQQSQSTLRIRQGACLPHWTRDGATYTVTFRLGDSLPRQVLEAWLYERRDIRRTAQQAGR